MTPADGRKLSEEPGGNQRRQSDDDEPYNWTGRGASPFVDGYARSDQ